MIADLRRVAKEQPTAPALIDSESTLSYQELMTTADEIAACLRSEHGVLPGDRVALLGEPTAAMVAALVGILISRACAVTLHPEHPDERLRDILVDSHARVVITDRPERALGTVTTVPVQARPTTPSPGDVADDPQLGDAAYVVYTSGTTGEPKGVLVGHAQLSWSTSARREVYPGPAVFLLLSPLAFDSSAAGVWGTLTSGGSLVTATSDQARDPEAVVDLMDRHRVTRSLCVPSAYRLALDVAESAGVSALAALRTMIVAGESLPDQLIERHFDLLPGVALVNEYGPSEATIWSTYRRYDAPARTTIGDAVPGARLYVVDGDLRPVPDGEPGELLVGGPGVARGYVGRDGATADAFREVPWLADGDRVYRTGDLVRRVDGELEFLGRRDRQVKIRGQRIELEAVEAAVSRAPGVLDVAVLPDAEHTSLVAHVVMADGTEPHQVRDHLDGRLAAVQVPGRYIAHDRFPTTTNGKIDRQQLAASVVPHAAPEPVPATTSVVDRVAAAWAEVLSCQSVPATSNFFDLGGHSLAMVQLQSALERHTGVRVPVVSLFRYTTVSDQAALIAGTDTDDHVMASRGRRERAVAARRRRLEGRTE